MLTCVSLTSLYILYLVLYYKLASRSPSLSSVRQTREAGCHGAIHKLAEEACTTLVTLVMYTWAKFLKLIIEQKNPMHGQYMPSAKYIIFIHL